MMSVKLLGRDVRMSVDGKRLNVAWLEIDDASDLSTTNFEDFKEDYKDAQAFVGSLYPAQELHELRNVSFSVPFFLFPLGRQSYIRVTTFPTMRVKQ